MNGNRPSERGVMGQPAAPVLVGTEDISLSGAELLAGAKAGFGAGVAMGLVAIVVSLSYSLGPWVPFNDVSGALVPQLRNLGAVFNAGSVFVGTLVHFSISVLLGILFAAIYSAWLKLTFKLGVPIVIGMAFGIMTWMAARYFVLPLLRTGVYGQPAFLLAHAVFGAALGGLYPLMRRPQA